jgi:8-oxo-dGTP pyrophosphatase MutT (NUDIX family)
MSQPPEWFRMLAETAAEVRYPISVPLQSVATARPAAVLTLFGESPGPHGEAREDVLLIERARDLRAHAGQPAFPGGAVDPDDDGLVATALREAVEETGLDPAGVLVAATLPPLPVPVSGFIVTPVLAWWERPSAVYPVDTTEVAAVARVPVAELTDPANRLYVRLPNGWTGVAFRVGGLFVWGTTAVLLAGVLTQAGLDRPWDQKRVENLPAEILELATRDRRKEPR